MTLAFNPLVFAGLDKGGSGAPGPEGPAGAKGEFNFTGAWTAKAARTKGDAVTRNGTTWACIKTVTEGEDKEPGTEPAIWKPLAEKGAAGATGEKGEKGLTGEAGSPKTAKAPLEVSGTEIVLKAEGITAGFIGPEAVETAKIKDKAVTDKKLAGLTWENVEAVNAKLTQTVTIQVAVFNGLVFIRGLGKVETEIAAKGILFTLPAAARPATARTLLAATQANGAVVTMLGIKTNGEVETVIALAAGKIPNFDGLSFSL